MKFACLGVAAVALLTAPSVAAPTERDQRAAVTVLLRESTGNPLGSGVVVAEASGGVWVATNRHVVDGLKHLCVVAPDRPVRSALVMPAVGLKSTPPLDLALLWWPAPQGTPQTVAVMQADPPRAQDLPLVVASGYPSPTQANRQAPTYTEATGLLVPLLRQPLQGGFALAYTADVQKGMSGGGVFLGNRLIGLNGTHPNPLWPGQWLQVDGKAVSADLNAKLEVVALGIPVSAIQQAVKATKLPDLKSVVALADVKCAEQPDQPALGRVKW